MPKETPEEVLAKAKKLMAQITHGNQYKDQLDEADKVIKNYRQMSGFKSPQRKAREKRPLKDRIESGKGYVYGYDKEGKSRPLARILMEEHLGRKLEDHEQVTYRDGNKSNCVLENLVVVYKTGTPLDFLTCRCCGARGNWEVTGDPKTSVNDS